MVGEDKNSSRHFYARILHFFPKISPFLLRNRVLNAILCRNVPTGWSRHEIKWYSQEQEENESTSRQTEAEGQERSLLLPAAGGKRDSEGICLENLRL